MECRQGCRALVVNRRCRQASHSFVSPQFRGKSLTRQAGLDQTTGSTAKQCVALAHHLAFFVLGGQVLDHGWPPHSADQGKKVRRPSQG